jgi:hypothetical protein
LVEIIVVVAIIAVVLTMAFLSVNTIFALDVQKTAKEITSDLAKVKIACMTREGDVYMRLYKNESGIMIERYENGAPVGLAEKVGKANLTVTCYTSSETDGAILDEIGITLAFNRSDGSFKPSAGGYYTKLVVSSGDNSRTITLWPETGKVTYDG